jgi:hypothetical protein
MGHIFVDFYEILNNWFFAIKETQQVTNDFIYNFQLAITVFSTENRLIFDLDYLSL